MGNRHCKYPSSQTKHPISYRESQPQKHRETQEQTKSASSLFPTQTHHYTISNSNPAYACRWSVTRVGAIRRLFFSPPTCTVEATLLVSLPDSFLAGGVGASSLFPRTLLPDPLNGVCGGVVIGTPATVAATPGIAPTVGVGLFMVVEGPEIMVLTEEADEDRVGELARRDEYAGDNGGNVVGIILPVDEVGVGLIGVNPEVGVGVPELWGTGPVYLSPNSPGENITTEQNPSVDVMSRVSPSEDLQYGISMAIDRSFS